MIVEEQTRLSPVWGKSTVVSLIRLRPNKWANDYLDMGPKGVIFKGLYGFRQGSRRAPSNHMVRSLHESLLWLDRDPIPLGQIVSDEIQQSYLQPCT